MTHKEEMALSKIIEDLLDAAFRELQHDTGPADIEWVHSRMELTKRFKTILADYKRKPHAVVPAGGASE